MQKRNQETEERQGSRKVETERGQREGEREKREEVHLGHGVNRATEETPRREERDTERKTWDIGTTGACMKGGVCLRGGAMAACMPPCSSQRTQEDTGICRLKVTL